MPELPEVETVCRGLEKVITDRTFTKVENFREDLRFPFPPDFAARLTGKKVTGISRRAKYIIIELNDKTSLIAHLGMSGKIIVYDNPRPERAKHDHVIFRTDNGLEIAFNDPRRFGMMDLALSEKVVSHKLIANLGIEPLSDDFDGNFLSNKFRNRKSPVKTVIMNANIVVGVGNIYASESLFRSNISPIAAACEVNMQKCELLAQNIKNVLKDAIAAGGSTLRDYVTSSGDKGYFQHSFSVYGKENLPCPICHTEIKRIVQTGRSTFYCPQCQN